MEEGLSSLPLRVIEYAFTHHMKDVLQVLGPPPWLEGDVGGLTLNDSCSIRVVAAQAWIIMERRDIEHFEQVMEFLDITHTLLPHAVTPIKHMKIMFGLKTLIIMWMLSADEISCTLTDKMVKFFPDTLPQYHRSSRRHMELMQRTQRDFKIIAKSLAHNPEIRKAYMKDKMQEQYGECYAKKLEERLLHYLEELDKALPQPTYIDQVLNKSQPLGGREELLHQILTCDSASPSTALKRLLKCGLDEYQRFKLDEDNRLLVQEGSPKIKFKRTIHDNTGVAPEVCSHMVETASRSEQKGSTERLCSRHGKQMKSILLECSEELVDLNSKHTSTQTECTHTLVLQPIAHRRKPSPQGSSCSTSISKASLSVTPSLQLITPSSESSAQPTATLTISKKSMQVFDADEGGLFETGSPLKSKPVSSFSASSEMITPAPEPPVQTALSPRSSSSFDLSSFPLNQILQESTYSDEQTPSSTTLALCPTSPPKFVFHQTCLSSSPPETAAFFAPVTTFLGHNQQQKTVRQFLDAGVSFHSRTPSLMSSETINASPSPSTKPKSSQESSSDDNSSFPIITQASLSLDEQESFSPLFHQPLSSSTPSTSSASFLPPLTTFTPTQNDTHISDLANHGEEFTAIECNPRLSLETQSFLLLCKWLQPHVKLHRLSQQRVNQATLTMNCTEQSFEDEANENEEYSFDVNALYTDSESEPQYSDDPDYNPPKKWKL